MTQPFSPSSVDINSPYIGAFAVTPNNDTDLPTPIRAVSFHNGNGTISFIGWDGQTYTTGTLNHGVVYRILARRIRATGTTATGLTGWI